MVVPCMTARHAVPLLGIQAYTIKKKKSFHDTSCRFGCGFKKIPQQVRFVSKSSLCENWFRFKVHSSGRVIVFKYDVYRNN